MVKKLCLLFAVLLLNCSVISGDFDKEVDLLDRSSFKEITDVLEKNPLEIYLMRITLTKEDSAKIAEQLKNNTSITKITLDEMSKTLTGKSAFDIAEAIGQITTLKVLRLFNNSINLQLANGFKSCCFISCLDLTMCNLCEEEAVHIAYLLANGSNLSELKLKENKVKKSGARIILNSLKNNKKLSKIILNDNKIKNVEFDDFYFVLSSLPSITSIDFQQSYFDGAQIENLAKCLQSNLPITRLAFGNCRVESSQVKNLAESLKHHRTLTDLELISITITSSMLEEIIDCLKCNTVIKKLEFNTCNFSDSLDLTETPESSDLLEVIESPKQVIKLGLIKLLTAITNKNTSIRSLNLICCGIQIEEADKLVNVLKHNLIITHFNMKSNNYSSMGSDLSKVSIIDDKIAKICCRNKCLENFNINFENCNDFLEILCCVDSFNNSPLPWEIVLLIGKHIKVIDLSL